MTIVRSFEDFKPPKRFDAIPFTQVKVSESADQAGPWTDLETHNLSPTDSDPSNPEARDVTITTATEDPGWYLLTWIDANGALFVSDPIWSEHAALDRIRERIGDTDTADELLGDDEINSQIARWPGNETIAAANCADQIAAKFARGYNVVTDGTQMNRSERVNHYTELAARLRAEGALLSFPPGTVSSSAGTAAPALYGTA